MNHDAGRPGFGPCDIGIGRRCLRFLAGLLIFAAVAWLFASGYSPPGVCGEVLRHNQAMNIDASALFYQDVEHASALEEGVRVMRLKAESLRRNRELAE